MRNIGIDLGTTNSALAWVDDKGFPVIVANREGKKLTPSVVQVTPEGTMLAGDEARNALALEVENTARFFKRDMGTDTTYWHRGREVTPVELSTAVLAKLCDDAADQLGERPSRAVITVPAYFQDRAREATIEAACKAGLEVIQILNEPTAAILYHGMKAKSRPSCSPMKDEEIALVYDLGGGTFDVSLAKVTPDGVEMIATAGNQRLGGKEWDDRLVDLVTRTVRESLGLDPKAFLDDLPVIAARCEEAKKQLTSLSKTALTLHVGARLSRVEITRAAFEDETRDLLEQTAMLMDHVMREAGLPYSRLGRVLLVGGSTRMPMCAAMIKARTGLAPDQTMNPDECVALGAALRARQLDSATGISLKQMRDVMGHSLGMIAVSVDGERYVNSIMIARNQPIPSEKVQGYKAQTDDSISVYVTQGETADPRDCEFAAKFVVSGISPREGGVLIDVGYAYDRDGVIAVTAAESETRRKLDVRKEAVPADMSWVYGSPKRAVAVQRTIYAAIDLSGSMTGEPLREAKAALHAFVDRMELESSPFGLISFADSTRLNVKAGADATKIRKAIDRLAMLQVGGGNRANPFRLAAKVFPSEGPRYLLVLTDGVWANIPGAAADARRCHALGIEIIAIGFGHVNRNFLRQLSTADESVITSAYGNLVSTFERIAQELGKFDGGLARPNQQLTLAEPRSAAHHG